MKLGGRRFSLWVVMLGAGGALALGQGCGSDAENGDTSDAGSSGSSGDGSSSGQTSSGASGDAAPDPHDGGSSGNGASSGSTSSSGSTDDAGDDASVPPNPSPVRTLAAGNAHYCALRANGSVKCWGRNDAGQLGLGNRNDRGDAPDEMGNILPAVDLGGRRAISVAAGGDSTCVVLEGGDLTCFGRNDDGQLGLGIGEGDRGGQLNQMGANLMLVDLGTNSKVRDVSVGMTHSCAVLDDGRVKCWGDNSSGQLGAGDLTSRGRTPVSMGDNLPFVQLGSNRTAVEVQVGSRHACARLDDASLKCWGNGQYLGLERLNSHGASPESMGDGLPTVDLATLTVRTVATSFEHTCALIDRAGTDAVKCWGASSLGQLGFPNSSTMYTVYGASTNQMGGNLPAVDLGGGAVHVTVGARHSCALNAAAEVRCWGSGSLGQLGRGSSSNTETPQGPAMLGIGTVVSLQAAHYSTCARFQSGAIRCWGSGSGGQLGNGSTSNVGTQPTHMGEALADVDLGN